MNDILDSKQLSVVAAVRQPGSRVFVEGGPGIGKTTTALAAACDVLGDSRRRGNERALFVAFSRSAVAQIANNLTHLHPADDDRIEITTLDGLALRIISGFGRYHGRGIGRQQIQSAASKKISGIDGSRFQYDELIPLATNILKLSPRLLNLMKSRWCIVVCDEFQDISTPQLEFIELLCGDRLMLLGDRDQLIYGWRGADIRQFDLAKSGCNATFDLGSGSYRDRSLEFPKLASAFRLGGPIHCHLETLANLGRLRIERVGDDDVETVACELAVSEPQSSSVGLFARHIETVTSLGERLRASRVAFETAGTSEVYAEALEAMLTLYQSGLGRKTFRDIRLAFARVCASLYRGEEVPDISRDLIADDQAITDYGRHCMRIQEALSSKVGDRVGDVVWPIVKSWHCMNLGLAAAQWDRAASEFRRCAESLSNEPYTEATVDALEMAIGSSRNSFLLNSQLGDASRITLMTYNQSKGREFDTVIHVHKHKSEDYWGPHNGREESLRLIGVAISRSRKKLVVVSSHEPHDLARPFIT